MVHTLCFRLNIQKPSRRKKLYFGNVYVVNLDPAVMTLHFWGTRWGTSTSPIDWSQHQHLQLIRTHHLAQTAWSLICFQCTDGHDACAKCCIRINRKCWCCDQPIGYFLVPHRVSLKGSAITAGPMLTTYTCSEIKIFLTSMVSMWAWINTSQKISTVLISIIHSKNF